MDIKKKIEVKISNSTDLIYEDAPHYDLWLKLILGGTLALTFILGIWLLKIDLLGAWLCLGVTAFDALLFHAVLPRRYQIFEDRIRIILGYPFAFNIPLATIRVAQAASGAKAFAYWGIRCATSISSVVEIVRSKGWNLVISPGNRDAFLEHLNEVLSAMPKSN